MSVSTPTYWSAVKDLRTPKSTSRPLKGCKSPGMQYSQGLKLRGPLNATPSAVKGEDKWPHEGQALPSSGEQR